jgi:hypothetical protein
MAFVAWLFSALVLVGVMATLALLVEPPGVIVAMGAGVVVGVLLWPGSATRNWQGSHLGPAQTPSHDTPLS